VLKKVDVSYGMHKGLQEAISQSEDVLGEVKITKERKILQRFFDEAVSGEGKYVSGYKDTIRALELGAVELLLCWEDMKIVRYTVHSKALDETAVVHYVPKMNQEPAVKDLLGKDEESFEIVDKTLLIDWLCEHYKEHGSKFELVTDVTDAGSQFVHGFGGIGAILRYKLEFEDDDDEDPFVPDFDQEEDEYVVDDDEDDWKDADEYASLAEPPKNGSPLKSPPSAFVELIPAKSNLDPRAEPFVPKTK